MRNIRDRREPNNLVVHITNRTVEGLPFLPRPFMEFIIAGIMAKSQEMYNVQICHFIWMSNHYHIILAGNGKYISDFIGYMQSEIARACSKISPLFAGTGKIWADRFKEQRLATSEDVINMIVYLYCNPIKAGLVRHIEEWSGFNSYKAFKSGSYVINAKWLPSRLLNYLPKDLHKQKEITLIKKVKELQTSSHQLIIKPYIWKRCFPDSKYWTDTYIYKRITNAIAERELEYSKTIKHVLGIKKIQKQSINMPYKPKKKTRTPFVICHIPELLSELIQDYKDFCAKCKLAWKTWRTGNGAAKYLYGAFRPSLPILSRTCYQV